MSIGEPRIIEFPGVPHEPSMPQMTEPLSPDRMEAEQILGITHEDMLAMVMEDFEEAKKERKGHELTWYLNLAFYLGDHYATVDSKARRVILGQQQTNVPRHRVRATWDRLVSATNNVVAQLVRSMPTLTAHPATQEAADVDGAMMASSVLEHEWHRMNLTALDHDIRLWKCITGTVGVWTRWNEAAGPLAKDPETGEPLGPRGENECIACPPFTLYPDPLAKRERDLRWFIHASEQDPEVLKELFPEVADQITSDEGVKGEGGTYEKELKNRMGASLSSTLGLTAGVDTSTVINYFHPRSKRFPNGVWAIVTPGVTLWMGENPWAHFGAPGEWNPIDIYRHIDLSASFWGDTPYTRAVPIQKLANKLASQLLENANLMTRGRYWAHKLCRWNSKQMTGEPGEVMTYDSPPELMGNTQGYRPEREDPPPFPTGYLRLLQECIKEIEDIFSYHAVLQGQTPPGVRSGTAIDSLAEKDEVNQFPVAVRDNRTWSTVGRRLLQLVRENWTDERLIRVRGDDGETEILGMRGANVPEHVDVIVEADTMLPSSRVGRLQALVQLVQFQILDPRTAQEAIFSGFGTVQAAIHRATLDQRKQRRENRKLIRGILVMPDNFDIHPQHMEEINVFRKSVTYERMKDMQVQVTLQGGGANAFGIMEGQVLTIKQIIEIHAQVHGVMMLKQAQVDQQAAAAADPQATGEEPGPEGAPQQGGPTGGPGSPEPDRGQEQA